MSDSTASTAKKSDGKAAPKPDPVLARAAESGDAGIQILVARRDIHVSNGDAARVAELDAELADLGYAV